MSINDDATFQACIDEVLQRAPEDPADGIFGPQSAMWRISGSLAVPPTGVRAVLLQIAHPAIAAAGVQNSRVREEFAARSVRTFRTVYQMMYGDRETALRAARHVHQIHARVRGHIPTEASPGQAGAAYRALDPVLLQWVLATMVDSGERAHALFLRPLSADERESYYRDMVRLGLLFGIPSDRWPAGWAAFERWFEQQIRDELEVGPVAMDLAEFLFDDAWPSPTTRIWAGGLLPPSMREAFGLPWSRNRERAFQALVKTLRVSIRCLPPPARRVPYDHAARWRVARARLSAAVHRPARWWQGSTSAA